MRLPLLMAVAAILGGCSPIVKFEVQNEGPAPVAVAFRFEENGRQVERVVEVPERGTETEGLWYSRPKRLEIEAKWPNAVRRQVFADQAIAEALNTSGSGSGVHGLSVSPEGIRWVKPTVWVRLQSPVMIPILLFFFVFAVSRWIRWRIRQGAVSAAPR